MKKVFIFMTIMVLSLCMISVASAGVIRGRFFVLKPWLENREYKVEEREGRDMAIVPLYYQVENTGPGDVRIIDMDLEWTIRGAGAVEFDSGLIDLNFHGAFSGFSGYKIWRNSVDTQKVLDFSTPHVRVRLPRGEYNYSVCLRDKETGAYQLCSNITFYVR